MFLWLWLGVDNEFLTVNIPEAFRNYKDLTQGKRYRFCAAMVVRYMREMDIDRGWFSSRDIAHHWGLPRPPGNLTLMLQKLVSVRDSRVPFVVEEMQDQYCSNNGQWVHLFLVRKSGEVE